MRDATQRFLCISSYEKGQDFMRQCAEIGVKPTLLTVDKLRDAPWPHEILEDIAFMRDSFTVDDMIKTVCWMCRGRHFDRVIALDEFDLDAAAKIREHTRIPGMGVTSTAYYRDKLAMRTGASESGFLVPEFCRVLNYDELRAYMKAIHGPWLLKPRAEALPLRSASAKCTSRTRFGGRSTNWVTCRQIICWNSLFRATFTTSIPSSASTRWCFPAVHQYGKPPMQVMHEGGVFTTRTVDRASRDWKELTALNARLAPDLGMARGVTHAEYIRAHEDGRFYFLEIAARVGGAFISDLIETATGVNLWREWARIEVADLRGEPYVLPQFTEKYAGGVLCLAKTEEPDTSAFDAPEIVVRMKKHHHAGLIVCSENPGRVRELLERYSSEFAERFLCSPFAAAGQTDGLKLEEAGGLDLMATFASLAGTKAARE